MKLKKGTAGLLIENNKGEILVLHRKVGFPEGGTLGLVGGSVKADSILESLINKVAQEIGLFVTAKELEKVKVFGWTNPKVSFHLYRLKIKNEPNIDLNEDGHSGYIWEQPKVLYNNYPLMKGLYKIIEEVYL